MSARMKTLWVVLAISLLVIASELLGSCGPPARVHPCGGVSGACLEVELAGSGELDTCVITSTMKNGESKVGTIGGGACALPCLLQLRPPAGVAAADITAMTMTCWRSSRVIFSAKLPELDWPPGSPHEVRYYLGDVGR